MYNLYVPVMYNSMTLMLVVVPKMSAIVLILYFIDNVPFPLETVRLVTLIVWNILAAFYEI